jgi:hypothetical protein
MASTWNVTGLVSDGSTFSSSGGLDGGGRTYSSNLLWPVQTANGALFSLAPPNGPDAVSNATITLPAGQFSTLQLLATGVNGSQPSQTFTVKDTDGTTASFTQSLTDWSTPQGYPGESNAITTTTATPAPAAGTPCQSRCMATASVCQRAKP